MITKADWQAVHDEIMAEERRKLGEPPTFDEVLAYTRGELSEQEAERVRALLVWYPELARTIAEPFPEDEADGRQLVSDDELTERWAALEKRIDGGRTNVRRFPRIWIGVAAALAVVFTSVIWQSGLHSRRLPQASALIDDSAEDYRTLRPGGFRGGGNEFTMLEAEDDDYRLAIPIIGSSERNDFRLEIVDSSDQQLWSSEILRRPPTDTFALVVPRAFLKPGQYEIVLHGVEGAARERLAFYPVRVP
jgi:hypothetical protein